MISIGKICLTYQSYEVSNTFSREILPEEKQQLLHQIQLVLMVFLVSLEPHQVVLPVVENYCKFFTDKRIK
jgi:hypothetical protein